MGISETKKQIVIDNYFKNTCDINTSIKEAFTKGFEVGLTKAIVPKADYNARLKAELKEIREEIKQLPSLYIEIQRPHSVVKRDVVELGMVCIILDKKISELGDKE